MNTVDQSVAVSQQQDFVVYTLNSEQVEIAVVPELGAKIISLKDLRTGREWLWHPPGGLKLFRNRPGDAFSQSPLAGTDECLPTIAPCSWQGRELPDHGEVWNTPWKIDYEALENGVLKTHVRLGILPFDFERMIQLQANTITISYELINCSAKEQQFIWAIHPLLRLQADDLLELPHSTRALLNGAAWNEALISAIPDNYCAKLFATPVDEGLAAIINPRTGDRLHFQWSPLENDTLGLWLTRGGWHGHHHFAIEPTNANYDSLAVATARNRCGLVAANSSVSWQLSLRVGL